MITKGGKSNFQEKELSHKCDTSAMFVRLFVATAILSINNLTSGELKARNSLYFCLTKFFFMFESTECII